MSEFCPQQIKAANRVDLSLWASMAVSIIMSSHSSNCFHPRH